MTNTDTSLDDIGAAINSLATLMDRRFNTVIKEQNRQGILLEDAVNKFDKNTDLLTAEMRVKKRVDKHEERLDELEATQKTIKAVVKIHSQQLESR